ncbi:uncharacterized protein LOC119668729 [Teleopsis dalmanni]|uniref:uncharacterized protein LOC119668721 n=1 Tax=Teleopsis dalmanni TaxID=139649 RepID=UPI0018CEB573|nr:uncharacterized protein LOC119668721 [Teleopsis dalmanni]XP_037934265.1 uncharacterized protein LOC119668729 [Teleopsis dalmanni]
MINTDSEDATKKCPTTNQALYELPDNINYQLSPITSMAERRALKSKFDRIYERYNNLLQEITSANLRFRQLCDQLDYTPKNTGAYEKLKKDVEIEYCKLTNDKALQDKMTYFKFLHNELTEIKEVVINYDNKVLANLKL